MGLKNLIDLKNEIIDYQPKDTNFLIINENFNLNQINFENIEGVTIVKSRNESG